MPNRSADTLFQLIKSLEKSEKRNFKLYVKRNSAEAELKIIQLFDALDKMEQYDEVQLLKKNRAIAKQQLSNLKAHLYKTILSSLRLIKQEDNITLQLHEQMDFARILYNKGLYLQSLKVLEKMKDLAKSQQQFTYWQQILFFEKKIEALFITRSMQDRADELAKESTEADEKISTINRLSNLSLQLYSWYIKNGVARNEREAKQVRRFFNEQVPANSDQLKGFYEQLYFYQAQCWVAYACQDHLLFYRYSQKWVDLFGQNDGLLEAETAHYIKGMHNLMSAHYELASLEKLKRDIARFKEFAEHKLVQHNTNYKILCFVYLSLAQINACFLKGNFAEGIALVPDIELKLQDYELYLDRHRVLTFYYKIACLYFGSGNNEKAIEYLNKIINWKVDLRTDLQCYARLLHLIAHYELGNYDLLDYLTKSVYRFMGKMQNLSGVEEEMFLYLRKTFGLSPQKLKPAFEQLLQRIRRYEGNRFETRAFAYLDVVSWLESKIQQVPVQKIVQQKFANRKVKK
jgi:hypothetical protein